MHKILEKLMCIPAIPATSSPVERIFNHGGIFMRPHRACLGSAVLTNLMFSKCKQVPEITETIYVTEISTYFS